MRYASMINNRDLQRLDVSRAPQFAQEGDGGRFAPTMDYYIPQWEERTSYGMRRIDPYNIR
jgi:hypothetical protein